jgi:hypothetical protein
MRAPGLPILLAILLFTVACAKKPAAMAPAPPPAASEPKAEPAPPAPAPAAQAPKPDNPCSGGARK